MRGVARINCNGLLEKGLTDAYEIVLKPLEIAQIVSSRFDFYDLDFEADGLGGVQLVASSSKLNITVRGKNTEEAVQNLLVRLGDL